MSTAFRHHDVLLAGLRLHYADAGEGPPLLLIHGWGVSHEEWKHVVPLLAPHFRCIVPDLPGHGGSEKRSPSEYAYTREAFASTLVDLLSALSINRAHVVGHSMGGGIALTIAADHAEIVDRLVVVDPISLPFKPPIKGRLPTLPVLGPLLFRHVYNRALFRDYFVRDVWAGHAGVDLVQVDRYYDMFDPPDAREATYAALRAAAFDVASLGPKIGRVRAPTLVVWGDDDRVVPTELAQKLTRMLPKAELVMMERCGHAPNEEKPAETAAAIERHLTGKTG